MLDTPLMYPPFYESGYIGLTPNTLNVYTIQYAIKKASTMLSEGHEEHAPDQDVSLLYTLILHGNKYTSSCTWTVCMEYITLLRIVLLSAVRNINFPSVDGHYGPPVQSPLLAYTNLTN